MKPINFLSLLIVFCLNLYAQDDISCPFSNINKVSIKLIVASCVGYGGDYKWMNAHPSIQGIDTNIISEINEIGAVDKDSVFWRNLLCNEKVIFHKRNGWGVQYYEYPIRLCFIKSNGDTINGGIISIDTKQFSIRDAGKSFPDGWDVLLDKESCSIFYNRLMEMLETASKITISNFNSKNKAITKRK